MVSLRNCSLTLKMLLLTAVVGVVVWALSDAVQTSVLSEVFREKLSERLSREAEKQRIMFDRYVKGHHTAVKLFVTTSHLHDYIENTDWATKPAVTKDIKYYSRPPSWLPRLSVMRNFLQPRYLLLLDTDNHVREVYQASKEGLPDKLLRPDNMLLRLSHDQGYLTKIDNAPYLVASEKILDKTGKAVATLVLASPLDEQFLIASQGSLLSDQSAIALLAEHDPLILVSSNPALIQAGNYLGDLKSGYLMIGQGFFDYGATDIIIELASFVSMAEMKMLTREVISEERMVRGMTALAFIVSFVLIMYLVTRRLQKFTSYVVKFSKHINHDEAPEESGGDEIDILERNFNRLADAVESETAALEYQALHDPLTELPNRKLLNNRLQQEILRVGRNKKSLVLIMSDLNHFKEINDTLGHHVGDIVLQQAATRLFRTFRKTDSVARLGGDEFAILLPETSLEQARHISQKVVEAFEIPFVVEGNNLSLGISMGLVECPTHGDDVNILVQRADVAMYIAKRNNLGFSVYDPDKDTHSVGRLALMTEFRTAIEECSLDIVYQPKVDFSTREIIGAEALLRWNHPQRGCIEPDEFIPLAEQTGLIKPLTTWVLDMAVQQCLEWRSIWPEFNVAVNLSVHNLHDAALLDQVRRLIDEHHMPPSCLTLEITEGDIMSNPIRAREILETLDMMGIALSVDDFGTGYSSLSYLKQLPVSELKIDKSFVMEMIEDENDEVIVKATIDLAHNLGLKTVAEGVADQKTWDFLRSLNCDIAQGYFISRPVSAEEFARLASSSHWPVSASG
ncbi:MAG: EAL domain-containing protein [Gammaproteobacteria bacterium]|nr:EAL domain-containing protein [Gammaproteobacteria bacterium]